MQVLYQLSYVGTTRNPTLNVRLSRIIVLEITSR
jgi:hypothetical protein